MARWIVPDEDADGLDEAVDGLLGAKGALALTGAGISVESGIPDFRSPGGLWSRFRPEEYATIQVFFARPDKAWKLYRAMGESLKGTKPNDAHRALAYLERVGRLAGVITQNVDGLHQAAGSREVVEMHGDHRRLQCLACRSLEEVREEHFTTEAVPCCRGCGHPLKPNVVLFGEDVRGINRIEELVADCDLMLLIGTSAQIYPAAGLPAMVRSRGGRLYEFNLEPTELTRSGAVDLFFKGPATKTLNLLARSVEKRLS